MVTPTIPPIGMHALLDLFGIDTTTACDEALISSLLHQAASLAGATVLQSHFHHFGENMGVTGVLLLSESHISIHTWPEYQFAAVDIFICGKHQIEIAADFLKTAFTAQDFSLKFEHRGNVALLPRNM